jgi:hypothetical protein
MVSLVSQKESHMTNTNLRSIAAPRASSLATGELRPAREASARLLARLAAWRRRRRESRAERHALWWEEADRIPPWAFGILHR